MTLSLPKLTSACPPNGDPNAKTGTLLGLGKGMQTAVIQEPTFRKTVAPWPFFDEAQLSVASQVLSSGKINYWTGNEGRLFENEFATATQTHYAIALANGTLALEAAWHVLDLKPGDEVIVTPRSFMASAASVVYCGGTPVFADVDLNSGNVTADTVAACISPRTRAILAVHLGGWPCPMAELRELADSHDLALIEDCAQAHGAAIDGKPVGGWGDLAAWSFCQDKIMTTAGEGGMITTNREDWWNRIWSLKDHGKSYDAVHNRRHAPGFRWLHESIGTNWRLTELQAAIGRLQLARLEGWVARRTAIANVYKNAFEPLNVVRCPRPAEDVRHAFYRCYVYLNSEALKEGWTRDRVMQEINQRGVPCFSGSCSEMYLEKAFTVRSLGPKSRLPAAQQLGESSLCFLVHPTIDLLDAQEMAFVAASVLKGAQR